MEKPLTITELGHYKKKIDILLAIKYKTLHISGILLKIGEYSKHHTMRRVIDSLAQDGLVTIKEIRKRVYCTITDKGKKEIRGMK